jgi:plastocyanin
MRLAAVTLLALVAAGCGGGGSDSAGTTAASGGSGATLVGSVGPGYTITLTRDGKTVTSLAPGTYTFEVDDKSDIHGFTLEQEDGDVEQEITPVAGEGTKRVTVELTAGEWKYYCPPHEAQMNGSFSVG